MAKYVAKVQPVEAIQVTCPMDIFIRGDKQHLNEGDYIVKRENENGEDETIIMDAEHFDQLYAEHELDEQFFEDKSLLRRFVSQIEDDDSDLSDFLNENDGVTDAINRMIERACSVGASK